MSQEVKSEALQGFDRGTKAGTAAANNMFAQRIGQARTQAVLLQYLAREFENFQIIDGKITFAAPNKQREYERLVQDIEVVIKNGEAFQRRAIGDAKAKIRKLTE